jgi:hypothetical protein
MCDEFDPLAQAYMIYRKLAGLDLTARYKKFQKQSLKQ